MEKTPERTPPQAPVNPSAARGKWAFVGFVVVAAFFLLTEHRAHLLGVLPYLLFLACPLMHLFHHRGHGGQRPHRGSGDEK